MLKNLIVRHLSMINQPPMVSRNDWIRPDMFPTFLLKMKKYKNSEWSSMHAVFFMFTGLQNVTKKTQKNIETEKQK